MANRLVSVWLGQCAAAGNAHFQLAKVIEPRRYPARALTRFARRRGRTQLLPALAPHRVSRNRCEERVPLVLRNGHGTLLSIHGVRASHSHEKQALEPDLPRAMRAISQDAVRTAIDRRLRKTRRTRERRSSSRLMNATSSSNLAREEIRREVKQLG
jgi:hypothetical protein